MSDKMYISCVPFTKDGKTHDTIEVRVSYAPQFKDCSLYLHAGETTNKGSKFEGFAFIMFFSPSEHYSLLPMTRDNKKKVEALRDQTFAEIKSKSGKGWEHLQEFCKKYGITLAEPVAA